MSSKQYLLAIFILLNIQSLYAHRALVEAKDKSLLSSEIAAKIINIPYRNGEAFLKDDILLEYDCSLLKTQQEKTAAELSGLKIKSETYERMVKLNSMGELDSLLAVSDVKKKDAELKMANIAVSKCVVKAPYDGKISKINVNEHEYVGEQKELIEIVGTKNLELNILIPSKIISSIKIGQKVFFISDETGSKAEGIVIGINPSADPVSQTVRIRAKLTSFEQNIIPGIVGNIQFGKK